MSGHECGWTEPQIARRWQFVADNLRRAAAGEHVQNLVFVGTG
jgi:hypothetical protein